MLNSQKKDQGTFGTLRWHQSKERKKEADVTQLYESVVQNKTIKTPQNTTIYQVDTRVAAVKSTKSTWAM